jgi:hypothetical protein
MTIEIHRPELEALIRERMSSGAFHDVEDVALRSSPVAQAPAAPPSQRPEGVDIDFERDPDYGRDVPL